ncbi:MAG: efflux RND transporter periplasmic adaptor subunit [Proteobacteria bacterium]|nr:efflux RND transporter periplasmic adaptor subunit [Pseudomonadota bacterium]
MDARRTGVPLAALAALALLLPALSACGGADAPAEVARPVLVVHPDSGPEAALSAFAGDVRAREESPLAFRIGGKLVKRNVDAGAQVRAGDVLAELDPGDQRLQAQAAQAQLAAAEAELRRTAGDRVRFEALARDRLVSQSAFEAQTAAWRAADEQARAARAQLDVARNQAAYAQLRAPQDGVVTARQAEAGQVVAAGQAIFSFAAEGGREVAIALPEALIGGFAIGQPVFVELWSAPGQRLPGRIREIAAAADPQARTYAARVALEGDVAAAVALGQSARVYVQQSGERAALRVPLPALQRDAAGGSAVWVVDPATHALRSVPVTLGAYGETHVPVLSGLSADDWVVAAGGHLLRQGQVVAPVDRQNRPVTPASPKPDDGMSP